MKKATYIAPEAELHLAFEDVITVSLELGNVDKLTNGGEAYGEEQDY